LEAERTDLRRRLRSALNLSGADKDTIEKIYKKDDETQENISKLKSDNIKLKAMLEQA